MADISPLPTSEPVEANSQIIGFIILLSACIIFGFEFVPIRKRDTRDAFFVQWVQCSVFVRFCTFFLFGFVLNFIRGFPPFNLIAAIGGFIYATGNICCVPVVNEMGIGLAMLVWGTLQIIVGWCVAEFGMFGTTAQQVSNVSLNYAGLALTIISGFLFGIAYAFDRPTAEIRILTLNIKAGNDRPTIRRSSDVYSEATTATSFINRTLFQNNIARKSIYLLMAVSLGCLHGLMLTPVLYIQDNDPNASDNVLDYVPSQFFGIFFFSTAYFFIYSLFKRGSPYVNSELVLPSVCYGILFCGGMTLLIIANHSLSQTVAYPIAVRLPAIFGVLIELFIFRSIENTRTKLVLAIAVLIGVAGVTLMAFSL